MFIHVGVPVIPICPPQIFRHSGDPVVGENKPYFPRELTSFRGWQMSPKAFGRLADQLLADWQANFWQMGRQAGSEYNSISRPVGKCSYKCSLVLLQLIRSSCYRLKSFSHPSTLGYSELVLQFSIVTNTHFSEELLVRWDILYNHILGTLQTQLNGLFSQTYKITVTKFS